MVHGVLYNVLLENGGLPFIFPFKAHLDFGHHCNTQWYLRLCWADAQTGRMLLGQDQKFYGCDKGRLQMRKIALFCPDSTPSERAPLVRFKNKAKLTIFRRNNQDLLFYLTFLYFRLHQIILLK